MTDSRPDRPRILRQAGAWDPVTRAVVLARLHPPPCRFHTPAEQAVAGPLLDLLVGQAHTPGRLPLLELVDQRIAAGAADGGGGEGWHHADLPEDGPAWRLSLAALDAEARLRHDGTGFAGLSVGDRHRLLSVLARRAREPGPAPLWHGLPLAHVWELWLRQACAGYYSHPLAWDETGFGGPAFPRGYVRLGRGLREAWEDPHPVPPSDAEGPAPDPTGSAPQPGPAALRRGHAAAGPHPAPDEREPVPGPAKTGPAPGPTALRPAQDPAPPASTPARRTSWRAAAATLRETLRPQGALRARNASAWLPAARELLPDMRRFDDDDEVDLVVVGCGAGGAVLTQRLAHAGWRVVCLEAGPFWDPHRDWVSDEEGSGRLHWTEPRVIDGSDPVPLGANNSGRGVGGSMVHFAGYAPRLHPSDLRTRTLDGVGADWPLDYADLAPYYTRLEQELPVAGQYWPWGEPHPYPHAPHRVGGNGEVMLEGCAALGIEARVGPVAIPNGRFGARPHCVYRGFCLQGCTVGAKASPLITHVPDALAHGAEIRADCMATEIVTHQGRATGVRYVHGGRERLQRARAVALACYSIETPRLLLNSGLCNEYDQVGRYVMVQGAPQVAGRFDDEIRMYKAPPPEVTTEQFYETDPARPYRRGFSVQTVSPLPVLFARHLAEHGHWGADLRDRMRTYPYWATLGALCEYLPQAGNRVTLDTRTDAHGLPVARFTHGKCRNDELLTEAATRTMADILTAAGARELVPVERCAHLVGGCRMATRPQDGVVDADLRTFAVPNLLVTDGSVLPTQGAANPALTIMALADRAAARLIAGARAGRPLTARA
ncbi:GMC oxidoreductase [Streptomyces sp. NPDC101160]|uniref:GMC family oxidoreductase n=1 Tax=Streptomyces sp. NPDC101160 TaxID=3366118 RepID=UPI0038304995